MDTEDLLKERGAEYGEAWLITGTVVKQLQEMGVLDRVIRSELFYNWITILCKLVRLLRSPRHLDSWRDIAGYAQLVVNHIETQEKGKHKS